MLKQIFVGGVLSLGFWATSSITAVPSFAQSTPGGTTTPETTPEAAPENAPAPTAVSQDEVQKFANAIEQFETIQTAAQQQANQILAGESLSWERFNQILQTERDPQAPATSEVTDQERQQFDRAVTQLSELQQTTRTQMTEAIQSEGLETTRFAEILAMVQRDPSLRQRIEQELQN
ncbi:MAG: DUF4168 domain-containing protein [Elainella sp. Prado103]|nr:DUF4168 domain-containing protein [Elainella sp. Prado103]